MNEGKPLLLLIDGHALVHRAFHALPVLTVSRTGEIINAAYGFTSMLLKLLAELKPSYCAVAFDRPTPTFRHEKFEAYKAHRPETPDDLKCQFGRVYQLVRAFHIPIFELDGYEADDILGTLSRQASEKGVDTVIATGDADAMQLVSPQVKTLMPRRVFNDTAIYDEAAVYRKYGVTPRQIADLKGLMGDSSDNIPGVPGVGEKTAAKLLQQFVSIEETFQHIDQVTPARLQKLLRDYEDQARQGKELATIITEVPITLNMDDCVVTAYDRSQVVDLFRELEFVALLPKLPVMEVKQDETALSSIRMPGQSLPPTDYRTVNTTEGFDQLLVRLSTAKTLVVDVETTGREAMRVELVGVALSPAPGEAYYLPVGHRGLESPLQLPLPEVVSRLKPILEDQSITKIAHNGKYDAIVLAQNGIEIQNLGFDTMIAGYVLGEKSLGLKAMAFSKLGIEMQAISSLIGTGARQITMDMVGVEAAADYACADADITGRLKELLETKLHQEGLWTLLSQVEMPLVPVLVHMERSGVALDAELLHSMSRSLGKQLQKLEVDVYNSVGHSFNINSSKQLSAILYDFLGLPRSRRTKSGYSTEAAVLEELKGIHPVVELILEYRQLTKLKSTYVDALPALINPRTGRVHTSFNQTGTTTGRLSSSEPNLQNIPIRGELGRKIRHAFIAEPGSCLMAADYSQIDLRVLAHLSLDPGLVAAFYGDEDIHTATASQVFTVPLSAVTSEMRRVAKTVNFGIIYGMSDYGLEQATELTREESAQFINSYFEKYTGVKEYIESTKRQVKAQGYVQTVLGRRRIIPEIDSTNRQIREAAERMAINMPVQGTSADIIKMAMINLYREMVKRGLKSKITIQVHDELVFEVPEDEMGEIRELVGRIMPRAIELKVPLKIDVKSGKNWGEMQG